MLSGLSIYSALAFGLQWLQPNRFGGSTHWIWLLGGSLYFPMVLLANGFLTKKKALEVRHQEQAWLVAISFLEWTGVLVTFLAVGGLMGIEFSIAKVVPLFIVASVIGMASMIPGAIGSFDLIMLVGLSRLGLSNEVAASWLLLYRLFYYIVPFLISLPLFVHTTGAMFNERYDGVPKHLFVQIIHKVTVIGFYSFGILLMMTNVFPHWFDQYLWLQKFHLDTAHALSQIPNIILGSFFLIVGRGIASRVKRTFVPACLLLVGTSIYCFFLDYGWGIQFYLLLLLILMCQIREELFRKQFVYAWESLTKDGFVLVLFSLSYLVLGVETNEHIPKDFHVHAGRWIHFSIAQIWFNSFLMAGLIALCSILLIRYLQGAKEQLGQAFDEALVQQILANYRIYWRENPLF